MDILGSEAREEAPVRADIDGGCGGVGRRADFEVGYRDEATFLRLLRRLPKASLYRSDRCKAYSVPPLILHVKGNGSEVNRNEGLHSKLRVRLNRLVRRTPGYSKRLYMLGRVA